ncbi:hypothetical protein llap_4074 [Limosa lapponica baueri]|uniref:Uncharacterized protein n=1 Tax=Limosa lapponica baueri TaxID=1758121 RepID=A0A2I0UHY5_LIMLA|nr:hypothetical protein llap_4074 [Limosa lapponica baueri]
MRCPAGAGVYQCNFLTSSATRVLNKMPYKLMAEVRQVGSHAIAWHKVHRAELTDINSTMLGLYSGNGLLLTEDCLGKRRNSLMKHHNDTLVDYQKRRIHHVDHYNHGNGVNELQG